MTQTPRNRIQELRHLRQWNQQELADAVGAHKITISKLERGEMQLTLDWMERLASAFKVSPAEVLRDSSLIRSVYVSGHISDTGAVNAKDSSLENPVNAPYEVDFQLDYGVTEPDETFFFFVDTDIYNPFIHNGDFVRFTHFAKRRIDTDHILGRICILIMSGGAEIAHGVLERGSEGSFDLLLPGGSRKRGLRPEKILVLTLAFGLPDFPADQFEV